MTKTITLQEADQGFARYVREVETGEEYHITRDGVVVARLVAADGKRRLTPVQEAAWKRSLARMKQGWPIGAGPLNRDELHER